MEAGAIRQGDPFQVASALWACDHGLASLEYRTPAGARSELFDWDAISDIGDAGDAARVGPRLVIPVRVRAPGATRGHARRVRPQRRRARPRSRSAPDGDAFVGEVPEDAVYGLVAEGDGPRFDPSKVLLDPWATEVWFPPGHDRALATQRGVDNAGRGPLAVARARPPAAPAASDATRPRRLRGCTSAA